MVAFKMACPRASAETSGVLTVPFALKRLKALNCIIHNGTAPESGLVEPRKVKHKEAQGCPRRNLRTKLALENLEHHWAFAVVFQAVRGATAATKHASVGSPMSTLEAVVCAPTVENRTECSGTHSGCNQRTQMREVNMYAICRGVHVVWETPANTIAHIF